MLGLALRPPQVLFRRVKNFAKFFPFTSESHVYECHCMNSSSWPFTSHVGMVFFFVQFFVSPHDLSSGPIFLGNNSLFDV